MKYFIKMTVRQVNLLWFGYNKEKWVGNLLTKLPLKFQPKFFVQARKDGTAIKNASIFTVSEMKYKKYKFKVIQNNQL